MTTVVCNLWTFVLAGQKKKAGGGGGREGRGGRGSLPQLCGRGQRETQARRPSSLLEHTVKLKICSRDSGNHHIFVQYY